MFKLILFILISGVVIGFVSDITPLSQLFSSFSTYVITPLQPFVTFLSTCFTAFFSNYYLLNVLCALGMSFLIGYILRIIFGGR